MNERDTALSAASAKFGAFLMAMLDRADGKQRREFHASLTLFATRLDPETRRILDTLTAQLRSRLTH
jgi:hypothetical protein